MLEYSTVKFLRVGLSYSKESGRMWGLGL